MYLKIFIINNVNKIIFSIFCLLFSYNLYKNCSLKRVEKIEQKLLNEIDVNIPITSINNFDVSTDFTNPILSSNTTNESQLFGIVIFFAIIIFVSCLQNGGGGGDGKIIPTTSIINESTINSVISKGSDIASTSHLENIPKLKSVTFAEMPSKLELNNVSSNTLTTHEISNVQILKHHGGNKFDVSMDITSVTLKNVPVDSFSNALTPFDASTTSMYAKCNNLISNGNLESNRILDSNLSSQIILPNGINDFNDFYPSINQNIVVGPGTVNSSIQDLAPALVENVDTVLESVDLLTRVT